MPAPADTVPRLAPRRSAWVAALLGWIVPGLGQVYVLRPWKGLWFFGLVCGTYALGLWLAGYSCVDPDRDPIWFAGQALAGGPTAAAWWFTRGLVVTSRVPTYDVGLLYVTVAALLNVVAIADALGTVDEYDLLRAEHARHRAAAHAQAQAEAERLRQAVQHDEFTAVGAALDLPAIAGAMDSLFGGSDATAPAADGPPSLDGPDGPPADGTGAGP